MDATTVRRFTSSYLSSLEAAAKGNTVVSNSTTFAAAREIPEFQPRVKVKAKPASVIIPTSKRKVSQSRDAAAAYHQIPDYYYSQHRWSSCCYSDALYTVFNVSCFHLSILQ
mmetsp:Transcript_34433/g.41198  ORF Transcript_34433/g.41198 Transcript_34433/m.41198 type:complete len:112 (+) Transcript_34433:114-449(+)